MVLCLKKRWLGDELLTLALLLSLLRPEGLEHHSVGLPVTSSGLELALQSSRRGYGELGLLAPEARGRAKTLLLDPQQYQQELLEELLALGRFDHYNNWRPRAEHNNRLHRRHEQRAQLLNEDPLPLRRGPHDYAAFLLTVETGGTLASAAPAEGERSEGGSSAGTPAAAQLPPADELSPEDMALIEVLWKQDVDLGVPLDVFAASAAAEPGLETAETPGKEAPSCLVDTDPDCKTDSSRDQLPATSTAFADTKGAAAAAASSSGSSSGSGVTDLGDDADDEEDEDGPLTSLDPWAGLPYTIDLETGEYVLREDEGLGDAAAGAAGAGDDDADLVLPSFDHFSLEEALKIVGLDDKEPLVGEDEESNAAATSGESSSLATSASDPVLTSAVQHVKSEADEADEGINAALSEMMQTHPHHHVHHQQHHMYHPSTHHRPPQLQGRVPLVRAVSMEQRWQDLAQLLTGPPSSMPPPPAPLSHSQAEEHFQSLLPPQPPSFPHASAAYPPHPPHPDPRNVLLHNATLAPPMGDLNATAAYSGLSALGNSSHLGSAVATSMNLTNSSEPMGPSEQSQQAYKMEAAHDMMYYQNGTSSGGESLNQTADGFLSSILNDEDLQLMDMAMNEGMYTMRLLEGSAAAGAGAAAAAAAGLAGMPPGDGDGSSDSAVSSMGSERGGAWGLDPHNATSPTDPTSPYLEYGPQHGAKYRPYDYSSGAYSRQQPSSVAQKKHHMFGKRFFQEQSNATALPSQSGLGATAAAPSAKMEMKFSCSLEFARHHAASAASVAEARVEHVAHNHSYHLPSLPESAGASHRPLARDKSKQGRRGGGASSVSSGEEESHLSRDEKRARAMNVPITVDDIINLPMDEFNERLSKYDLTEAQLSLIRDIRRRGKNKVAAQNCRKRKLDQILSLADEVKLMRDRKNRLLRDKESMLAERQRLKEKFGQLYRHVFQALRDPEGRPYSPYEYSLQQSADGSVLLVPRGTPTGLHPPEEAPKPPGPSSSNSHPHQHHQRRS